MFDKVDQLAASNVPDNSFDWIWRTPLKSWLQSSSRESCFWISGKPGSGKSTLMYYLTNARETKRIIHRRTSSYIALNFFFDYRADAGEANHEVGLVKCFLAQLCDQVPPVEQYLVNRYIEAEFKNFRKERWLQMLREGLNNLSTTVYAFIDGLDEYRGDHDLLASLLLQLPHQAKIKICFASRPESLLVKMLSQFPTLHMHQHNDSSIRKHIQYTLNIAQHSIPNIESVIDSNMTKRIVAKAHGVMIWARLVVDCLVNEARSGATQSDLAKLLDSLPKDLEMMYDQTYLRIAIQDRPQAAIMLWFLNECGGSCSIELLYGFWHFFYTEVNGVLPLAGVHNSEHFLTHVLRLCSSFMEIVAASSKMERGWSRLLWPVQSINTGPSQEERSLRMLHETLQAYVSSSPLIASMVPAELKLRYQGSLDLVCTDIVDKVSRSPHLDISAFHTDYGEGVLGKRDPDLWLMRARSRPAVSAYYERVLHSYWKPETSLHHRKLLAYSLSLVNAWLRRKNIHGSTSEAHQIVRAAICSPLTQSLVLDRKRYRYVNSSWLGTHTSETDTYLDLVIAMECGLDDYVDSVQSLGQTPSPTVCDKLATYIMEVTSNRENSHYDTMKRVLQYIWSRTTVVNLNLLFRVVEDSLCSPSSHDNKRFLLFARMIISQRTIYPCRVVWRPVFAVVPALIRDRRCMQEPSHALRRWALLVTRHRNSLDGTIQDIQLSDVFLTLLQLAFSMTNVGTMCEDCGDLLESAITHRKPEFWISNVLGFKALPRNISGARKVVLAGIERRWLQVTIVLIRIGAKPIRDNSLQRILDHLDTVQSIIERQETAPGDVSMDRLFLRPMRDIFTHYQKHSCWPDVGPYIKAYNLVWPDIDLAELIRVKCSRLDSENPTSNEATGSGQMASVNHKEALNSVAGLTSAIKASALSESPNTGPASYKESCTRYLSSVDRHFGDEYGGPGAPASLWPLFGEYSSP